MSEVKYDSITSRKSSKDESLSAKEYTIEEAIDHIGFGKFQIKAGLVCALTWIADSMEVNILGIIGPVLKCEWLLEDWQIAIYSSIIFISIAIFAPLVGLLSDRYGRRRMLLLTLLTGVYYGTLSAFSPLYLWLVILRFFLGCMIGGVPISTVYTSEFFPKERRGFIMAIVTSVSWAIGSLLEILLAYIVLNWLGWRVWLVASSIPLLFAALLVIFSRNTPRFSLISGRWYEATETIKLMAEWNNSTLPKGELVKSIAITTTRPLQDRVKDIFSKEYARITILTMVFGFTVQFAYYGTVMASSQLISKTGSVSLLGDSSGDKYSCSLNCVRFSQHDLADLGITAVAELIGVVVLSCFVDKLGRKLMLALPMVLLGVFTLFLAAVESHRTLLIVSLFGARLVALLPSCFIYVYCAEVYPTPFRTTGVAASFFSGRIGAAVSPFISQVLLNTHPQLGIFVFAMAAFIGAVSAILLPIETKGREMED